MSQIDETIPLIPVRIAVLTVSDTRDETSDTSGALLASMIEQAGHQVAGRAIVLDDVKDIRKQVKKWIKEPEVDVVITTGGTGFAKRDVTEAREFFEDLRAAVSAGMAAGKSLDELQKTITLDKYKTWAYYDRLRTSNIAAAYANLKLHR